MSETRPITESGASTAIVELTPNGDLTEQAVFVQELANEIGDDGSILILSHNDYVNKELNPWPYRLDKSIRSSTGLKLRNIFIVYKEWETPADKLLSPAQIVILFYVKSGHNLFRKDEVREKHIFKDIEWGKRTTCASGYHKERESERYPSKGRDPGNVFYKDKRDECGVVLDIFEYPEHELFEKLVKLTTDEGWQVITNMENGDFERTVASLGRILVRRDA